MLPGTTENVSPSLYYFRLVGLMFILFGCIYFIVCNKHFAKNNDILRGLMH